MGGGGPGVWGVAGMMQEVDPVSDHRRHQWRDEAYAVGQYEVRFVVLCNSR